MNTIIHILLSTFMLAFTNANTEYDEKEVDCFTIENFNSIVYYIEINGTPTSESKKIIPQEESLSLDVSIGIQSFELQYYADSKRVVVIDKDEDRKMSPYYVSIKNEDIEFSAYYSRIDTDEDRNRRAVEWCSIISELAVK